MFTAKKCVIPDNPDNGVLDCKSFGLMVFCTIKCNPGKQTFQYTFGSTCSQTTLEWQPIPDCVGAYDPELLVIHGTEASKLSSSIQEQQKNKTNTVLSIYLGRLPFDRTG